MIGIKSRRARWLPFFSHPPTLKRIKEVGFIEDYDISSKGVDRFYLSLSLSASVRELVSMHTLHRHALLPSVPDLSVSLPPTIPGRWPSASGHRGR